MESEIFMKLIINKLKENFCISQQRREFFDCQLNIYRKYIGMATLVMGIFNLALLIPDLSSTISIQKKLVVIIFRIIFSSMLFFLSAKNKSIIKMTVFFLIGTAFEILAIVEFLLVLNLYNEPNYFIQAMGMIILNIIVFLIPNKLLNMFCVSIIGTAGFLINSLLVIKPFKYEEFLAGAVYLLITILLCSLFAIEIDKHQFNEFVVKKELVYLSSTDNLTNTWNRNKLLDEFDKLKEQHYKLHSPISLVLIDVDEFKSINDKNGHTAADVALVEIVKLINCHIRNTDMLVRWGGDEFILLLPNTNLNDAIIILERIRSAIQKFIFTSVIRITCSFGVVESKDDFDLDVMIKQADNLMYEAKKLGGNHVIYKNNHL